MLAVEYYFDGKTCSDVPDWVGMTQDDCGNANGTCKEEKSGDKAYKVSATCTDDRFDYAVEVFGSREFVFVERYSETLCHDLFTATAFLVSSECQTYNRNGASKMLVTLNDTTGAVSIDVFNGTNCDTNLSSALATAGSDVSTRDSTSCVNSYYKIYSSYSLIESSVLTSASASASASASSDIGSTDSIVGTVAEDPSESTGTTIGIIVVMLVVVVSLGIWIRRRSHSSDADKREGNFAKAFSPAAGTDLTNDLGLHGLWNDEGIATSRIPREKVLVQELISRGGYGEVYSGVYNDQHVAVKMLQFVSRKSVKHVNKFLGEVKITATLDHPCIVQFVGVAWDSLADLCVVLEYMEGGDLRALLASYEAQGRGLGFDTTKVTIALHVAHGLTYLHSLDPPVLHRDLKSKNILLTSDLQAKITDFGISRERTDKTMTAGVGTSLWMAPEVMLGQRYDGKADMFSFGVVLSELDQHTLPYSHVKQNSDSGRKIPETAILQMVALGQIRVKFSSEALESMVALGNACVAVDPNERPTAAEALYRLQTTLKKDL